MINSRDSRDLRFTCSRIALLSLLKSWAGLIEFCNPQNLSGFKSIVDILYLSEEEVRKAVLDLLFEVINLQTPTWTSDYTTAFNVIDPSDFQDSWRLSDGFVAVEGKCVLPCLTNNVPNIMEIHLALLLYCFSENGLLEALVEIIVSSDMFLSVRTTVLLGQFLQLMQSLLPDIIVQSNRCLPNLISKAVAGVFQAKAAINALQSYHQLLKSRPLACSLYLDQIIQSGKVLQSRVFKRDLGSDEHLCEQNQKKTSAFKRTSGNDSSLSFSKTDVDICFHSKNTKIALKTNKVLNYFDHMKECEKLVRDSLVFSHQDSHWDWDLILVLFRNDMFCKMDELANKFVKNLIAYFKPSNNRFSHEEFTPMYSQLPSSTAVGLELIDWLLKSPELDSIRLLTDFFTDISGQLLSISTSRSAHDCLFSPQHMSSTMCQQYFLFIGRMSKYEHGTSILTNTDIFKQ